jgi:hypothetical protein
MNNEYTEFNGLFFDVKTCEAVKRAIVHAYTHKLRIRVFYGDVTTGAAWADEWDIMGTVGRSTGSIKIPLLIQNSRAMGGGAVLDACIVAIKLTNGGGFLYRHATFNPGEWREVPPVDPGYVDAVTRDGVIHAQFKKRGQAARYCQFMRGDRFNK